MGLALDRDICRPHRALSGGWSVMPPEHSARQRACSRQQQLRAERAERGLCPRCGKRPPEPGLKLCHGCNEKRRTAERARREKARSEGKQYGGRDPERCRRVDRAGDRRRRRAWKERQGCVHPAVVRRPEDNRSVCAPCREVRRALDRRRYGARRAASHCVRCNQPTVGGLSRCGRLSRAGEGARLCREKERRREETLCREARAGRVCGFVDSPPGARPAVSAAHIGPTPARPSVTWRRFGRRRSP